MVTWEGVVTSEPAKYTISAASLALAFAPLPGATAIPELLSKIQDAVEGTKSRRQECTDLVNKCVELSSVFAVHSETLDGSTLATATNNVLYVLEAVEKKMSKYAKYGTWESLMSEEEMKRDLRNFDRMINDAMNIFSINASIRTQATVNSILQKQQEAKEQLTDALALARQQARRVAMHPYAAVPMMQANTLERTTDGSETSDTSLPPPPQAQLSTTPQPKDDSVSSRIATALSGLSLGFSSSSSAPKPQIASRVVGAFHTEGPSSSSSSTVPQQQEVAQDKIIERSMPDVSATEPPMVSQDELPARATAKPARRQLVKQPLRTDHPWKPSPDKYTPVPDSEYVVYAYAEDLYEEVSQRLGGSMSAEEISNQLPDLSERIRVDQLKYQLGVEFDVHRGSVETIRDMRPKAAAFKCQRTGKNWRERLRKYVINDVKTYLQLPRHRRIHPYWGLATVEYVDEIIYYLPNKHVIGIVSPLCRNGDIMQYIKAHPTANRLHLLAGAAEGIKFLHDNQFIHANIKGSNVLIDDYGEAVISDFGYAKNLREPDETDPLEWEDRCPRYNARWTAAEWQLTLEYPNYKTDIWSTGMLMVEVLTGQRPMNEARGENALIFEIGHFGYRPSRPPLCVWLTDELWRIMELCWHADPDQRPDIATVYKTLREANKQFLRKPERTLPPGTVDFMAQPSIV